MGRYCKLIFFVLLALMMSAAEPCLAGTEPTIKSISGPFALNDTLSVKDPKFLNNAAWAGIVNRTTVNEVSLRVTDGVRIAANFSYKVVVDIECFSDPVSAVPTNTIANVELSVNYDINQGMTYRGVSTYAFSNAFKMRIKVKSVGVVTAGDNLPPAGAVRLTGTITVDRAAAFNQATLTSISSTGISSANKQLPMSWLPVAGADEYDLEWTTVAAGDELEPTAQAMVAGNTASFYVGADFLARLFQNNASRITTAGFLDTVALTFNDDYLVARVRGVQYTSDGIRLTGAWSYAMGTGFAAWNISTYWHSSNLNWQYSAAYAEEGKKKEVISYFDGTLRNRQTVSVNNTDHVPVVAENVYDLFGRPAASILPAPVKDSLTVAALHYFTNLNLRSDGTTPYSYQNFADPLASVCEIAPEPLSTSKGAAKYYSGSNPFQNFGAKLFHRYIPDAEGYPLSVTRYTPDNTGRIRQQGGVGAAFQPGAAVPSHTTKYIYGKPDQWELDQLFGNDAGFAEHYTKNTVIDPNNQISVSYNNASGKTVATALAGRSPVFLDSLPSIIPQKFMTSRLLKPEQFTFDNSGLKLSASTTFTVTSLGRDTIRFDLPAMLYSYSQTGQLCAKCYYDLNVKVTDPCNPVTPLVNTNYAIGTKSNLSANCTPDGNYTNTIPMLFSSLGEYNITFEFKLNRDDVEAYTDTLFNRGQRANVLSAEWKFVKPYLETIDFTGVLGDCRTAKNVLGTEANFTLMFNTKVADLNFDLTLLKTAERASYDNLVHAQYVQLTTFVNNLPCNLSPCDAIQEQMLSDVSPGGQYALLSSEGTPLQANLNVLLTNWRTVFPVLNPAISEYQQNYLTTDDGTVTSPNDVTFSFSDLVHYWNPAWAQLFLPFHPEYCKLQFCQQNAASGSWDARVTNAGRAADISTIAAGAAYNYTSADWLLAYDPFFTTGAAGNSYKADMQNDLNNYSVRVLNSSAATKSLTQYVDFILYCNNSNWAGCSVVSCRVADRDWQTYKSFYLAQKQKYYELARNSTTCLGACPVGTPYSAPAYNASCATTNDFSIGETSELEGVAPNSCPSGFRPLTITYNKGAVSSNTYVYLRYPAEVVINSSTPSSVLFSAGNSRMQICLPVSIPANSVSIKLVNCTGVAPPADNTAYNPPADVLQRPVARDTTYFPEVSDYGYQLAITSPYYDITTGTTGEKIKVLLANGALPCKRGITTIKLIAGKYDAPSPRLMKVYNIKIDSVTNTGTAFIVPFFTTGQFYRILGTLPPCVAEGPSCQNALSTKISRFDFAVKTNFFPTDTASAGSFTRAQTAALLQGNVEGLIDNWMTVLAPGLATLSAPPAVPLRTALVKFARDNGDINHINGASTLRVPAPSPNPNAPWVNFGDVLKGKLGITTFTPLLNPWLLESPYPYDKQPQAAGITVSFSNSKIADTLASFKAAKATAGYSGTLHAYLTATYGPAMTLTPAELNILDSASAACNYVLRQDVTLPVFMQPGRKGCITWTEYTNAKTALTGQIPGLVVTSVNYEYILTNYMNQQFGFALNYQSYLDYEVSHPGLLCNTPPYVTAATDVYAPLKNMIAIAVANGKREYATYVAEIRNTFRDGYVATCAAAKPNVTNKAQVQNYHYTLYYYDQADNLVRTIPPEGVQLLTEAQIQQVQQLRDSNGAGTCGTGYTGPTENADPATAFNALSGRLSQASVGAIELYLYSASYSSNLFSKLTPDGKYRLQISTVNNQLSVEIFHTVTYGSLSNVNRVTVSLSAFPVLQSWTHLVIQSSNFLSGQLSVYVNGLKAPVINNPLPVQAPDNLTAIKHMRLYNHLLNPNEVMINASNICLMPLNPDYTYWGRFNVPLPGSETTVAAGSTQETQSSGIYPAHTLPTSYVYNSTNQVLQQNSPDGGTNRYWYDPLSRLVFSQNDKQLVSQAYSYTKYDQLGRITEVGQKINTNAGLGVPDYVSSLAVYNFFTGTGNTNMITRTYYDTVNTSSGMTGLQTALAQTNLRKRVVASTYSESAATVLNGTYYSYDLDGNVNTLYQQVDGLPEVKQIGYEYDLISGKVNFVKYQAQGGKKDQFFYQYRYDAENRLTEAWSAPTALLRSYGGSELLNESRRMDASYEYYLHGPLARMELGDVSGKVQGMDYVYTLQGWLKGVNNQNGSLSSGTAIDAGQDGLAGNHATVSKDALAYSLGYYPNDYKPVGGTGSAAFAMQYAAATGDITGQALYNGNISNMTLSVSQFSSGAPVGYTYHYDQLNRLKKMRQHTGINGAIFTRNSITANYQENITYDGNGNILTYGRNGAAPTAQTIDSLKYNYLTDVNGRLKNNQLNYITDYVTNSNYTGDLKPQTAYNYTYDKIGNLYGNAKDSITGIDWSVYGKIQNIYKNSALHLAYTYDAAGNRVSKAQAGGRTTWYVRDAQGNLLALYDNAGSTVNWREQHLYGSSRLGMWTPNLNLSSGTANAAAEFGIAGRKFYELNNHLGNVMATISDKRQQATGTPLAYQADVISAQDYYPFGMQQPGRQYYAAGPAKYRYGFNGKENDNEVFRDATGNIIGAQQDYGMRIYDDRVGRFLSVDPLRANYPWYSPYQFAGNNPISFIDIDGLEELWPAQYYGKKLTGMLKQSEWSAIDRLFGGSSFNSAAMYNTQNGNSKIYEPIAQIHQYYVWAAEEIDKTKANIKFFDAAADVTGVLNVQSLYTITNNTLELSSHSHIADELAAINKKLLAINMSVIKDIINNGKSNAVPGSGIIFDLNYVKREQTTLTKEVERIALTGALAKAEVNFIFNTIGKFQKYVSMGNILTGTTFNNYADERQRIGFGRALVFIKHLEDPNFIGSDDYKKAVNYLDHEYGKGKVNKFLRALHIKY